MTKTLDRLIRFSERLCTAVALLSGALFLLLALFVTSNSTSRAFGGYYTAITDDISAYVLVAGNLGLAYTLIQGGHVRVDVVVPRSWRRTRAVTDLVNTALISIFALLLSVFCWRLSIESFAFGSRSTSALQITLGYPQTILATGMSLLALHAVLMFVRQVLRLLGLTDPKLGELDEAGTQQPKAGA